MRILTDTHVLVWAIIQPARLSRNLIRELAEAQGNVLFSAASIWEIAIKVALGRADFHVSPAQIYDTAKLSGFIELPVTSSVVLKVADLPLHHRDPFDRLLVAQAMAEPARLYTADRRLAAYSELVTLI